MNVDYLQPRELTDLEIIKGKILNPAQEIYLKSVFTEMTMAAAEVNLHPEQETRATAELHRAFDGGKRAFIAELLADSESAKAEIKLYEQTQSQTRS